MRVLYHVTFADAKERRAPGGVPWEGRYVATVGALPAAGACFHVALDQTLIPDADAIEIALPYRLQRAFSKAIGLNRNQWWYPPPCGMPIGTDRNPATHGCHVTLRDFKGRTMGELYATPYLFKD